MVSIEEWKEAAQKIVKNHETNQQMFDSQMRIDAGTGEYAYKLLKELLKKDKINYEQKTRNP